MSNQSAFSPHAVYGGQTTGHGNVPRVIISPHRYIQGKDTLSRLGKYISVLPSIRPGVLISPGGEKRFSERLRKSFAALSGGYCVEKFGGECSVNEVNRLAGLFRKQSPPVDSLIAIGGGKCLDAGKCVAARLGVPVVICPTIASTDAPCSAVSVMYSDDSIQVGPEFFPGNPALVVVDTQIIIDAPIRQLVAGMGDALATFYEARTCFQNPSARSMIGARPTITALAIAKLCADTVFENGLDAVKAIQRRDINEAFEKIVEANTLMSGVGFESGGLAAAHAIAAGLTAIPSLHRDYYHGELVSMGLLAHLLLEDSPDEAKKAGEFLARLGLPVHAGQLSLDMKKDAKSLMVCMEAAIASHLTEPEPFEVTPAKLFEAFSGANELGLRIIKGTGDKAYRDLHE